MQRLSEEKRYEIVLLMKKHNNVNMVSRLVGCSKEAVRRWWGRYSATQGVSAKKSPGKKPLMTPAARELALEMLAGNEMGGASSVAKHLKDQGMTKKLLSRRTITRGARKAAEQRGANLTHVRGKPKKGMTESTRLKRLKFARDNIKTDWRRVLFTDRSKFHFKYPGSVVRPSRWVLSGSDVPQKSIFAPSHPQCLNVYAGISFYGVTKMHVVAGSSKHKTQHTNLKGGEAKNITQSEFAEVLKNTLLPEGRRIFCTPGLCDWILQLDGDKAHNKVKLVVKEWNKAKGTSVQVLPEWPPNSPDLNPIENVWSWIQAQVNKKGCKSFQEFQDEVQKQLSQVPKKHLANYYKSMKKRMKLVIENDGGYTGY
jgi:hypothetical protein